MFVALCFAVNQAVNCHFAVSTTVNNYSLAKKYRIFTARNDARSWYKKIINRYFFLLISFLFPTCFEWPCLAIAALTHFHKQLGIFWKLALIDVVEKRRTLMENKEQPKKSEQSMEHTTQNQELSYLSLPLFITRSSQDEHSDTKSWVTTVSIRFKEWISRNF